MTAKDVELLQLAQFQRELVGDSGLVQIQLLAPVRTPNARMWGNYVEFFVRGLFLSGGRSIGILNRVTKVANSFDGKQAISTTLQEVRNLVRELD